MRVDIEQFKELMKSTVKIVEDNYDIIVRAEDPHLIGNRVYRYRIMYYIEGQLITGFFSYSAKRTGDIKVYAVEFSHNRRILLSFRKTKVMSCTGLENSRGLILWMFGTVHKNYKEGKYRDNYKNNL